MRYFTVSSDNGYSGCAKPVEFVTINPDGSVEISWSAIPSADAYYLIYRKKGTTKWSRSNGSSTSRLLTDLEAGSLYQYLLKTRCNGIWMSYDYPVKTFKPIISNPTGSLPSITISEIKSDSVEKSSYLEFIVSETNNEDYSFDLSGWTIDNSTTFSDRDINFIKLGNCFSSVRSGSVILIYDDENPSINIDPNMDGVPNANGVFQIPLSSSCLKKCSYLKDCDTEPLTEYDWNSIISLKSSGDVLQIRDGNQQLINAINWNKERFLEHDNAKTTNIDFPLDRNLGHTEPFLLETKIVECAPIFIHTEKINDGTPGSFPVLILGSGMSISCKEYSPETQSGNDASIEVSIAGGTPPFTIEWEGASNGSITVEAVITGLHLIENLQQGGYSITVTDKNGCESTCSTHIVLKETQTTCEEECTTIGPDNSDPDLCYWWEPENEFEDPKLPQQEVCPKESMTYRLIITDGVGEIVEIQEYEVNVSKVNLEVTPNPVTICDNNPITLDAGNGYESYSWKNSSEVEISQQQTIDVTEAGKYSVEVINQDGCSATEEIDVINASDPEEIRQFLEDKGFSNIPITVTGEVLFQGGSTNHTQSTSTTNTEFVDDCAKLLFSFDVDGIENHFAQVVNGDLSLAIQEGLSSRGKIVSYENICESTGCDLNELFAIENYDFSIQCYIYDAPQSDDDYLLVKYNEVSFETLAKKLSFPSLATPVELPPHEISYNVYHDNCIPESLPSNCNNMNPEHNYAIAKDPITGLYHGYSCINGVWQKGDPVETKLGCEVQQNPNTNDLPCPILPIDGNDGSDDIYGDGSLIFTTIYLTSSGTFGATPSLKAYLHIKHPNIYTTFGTELAFSEPFKAFGNSTIKDAKDKYVDHFTEGHEMVDPYVASGNEPLVWDCGHPFSEEVRTELINGPQVYRINKLIVDWMKNHNGTLDGLFIDDLNFHVGSSGSSSLSWYNAELNGSLLDLNFWPYQIFGYTQAIRIQVTDIKVIEVSPRLRFSASIILEVIDSYGAGHDDGERIFLPGLVEMFVLQHFRNNDNSSPNCDVTPCYVPYTHSTFISYGFSWYEH